MSQNQHSRTKKKTMQKIKNYTEHLNHQEQKYPSMLHPSRLMTIHQMKRRSEKPSNKCDKIEYWVVVESELNIYMYE
jgi:hypothetical protein